MKKTGNYMSGIRFFSMILLTVFSALFFHSILDAVDIETYEADVKTVPIDSRFDNIKKLVWFRECLYVLDSGNHRIMAVKDNKAVAQIGMIGNNKGELYYPSSFFIDANAAFYVLDTGNQRIQIMDTKGNYRGEIPYIQRAFGIAVNSRGLILVGEPKSKTLISVYNMEGKSLSQFGKIFSPSDIYGSSYRKYDKKFKLPMNRVHLAIGENDDIWVGFYHMPLICKYDNKGNLVYREILNLEGIAKLKDAVWIPSAQQEYITLGIDGVNLTMVINEIVFKPGLKKLFVLLGDNRILVLNTSSSEKFVIKPRIIKGAIEKIGVNDKGEIFLSFFFSSKLYRLEIRDKKIAYSRQTIAQ